MAKVLIIGSGGREHAIAKCLSKSNSVSEIFLAPGNGGTEDESKCSNINLSINNHDEIVMWSVNNNISLVVVGPEEPLIKGLADKLLLKNIPCFGPQSKSAQLEGSKSFGKTVMKACGIATAEYSTFDNANAAIQFLNEASETMRVVKADGIAGGKGVVVCNSLNDAIVTVNNMLDKENPKFGDQSKTIIIEEFLEGPEVSILAFCDGKNVRCFPPSQDHKRTYDADEGPNTGGMGAYCPCDLIDRKTCDYIEEKIVRRIVKYMNENGMRYQGILYVGLILTKSGPYVLEFNCRFGDPETQVILPMLISDLYEVMMACTKFDGLSKCNVEFHTNRYALCVVMASSGYPELYKKGYVIDGLDNQSMKSDKIQIIHAGTSKSGGDDEERQLITNGGRVLTVVAIDNQLNFCYNVVMDIIRQIEFEDAFYRKDIGGQMLKKSQRPQVTYANAGVDICAGDHLVDQIKSICHSSAAGRCGVVSDIGQFGALFDLRKCQYQDPLLVAGTDGVGTKLKIAQMMCHHDTIGQDLVAMCVNDILCHGAEPLFFLDYYATGKLMGGVAKQVLVGINRACFESNCALIGGETAEMPGIYMPGDFDLAGFVVGAVERTNALPKLDRIHCGDVIIGLPSNGLHSNGFSLVRQILENYAISVNSDVETVLNDSTLLGNDERLGETLLRPTQLYVKPMLQLLQHNDYKNYIHSLAHITGGGLRSNICRSIPSHLYAQIAMNSWQLSPIFKWLWLKSGSCDYNDFASTFNLGIGLTLVVSSAKADDIIQFIKNNCGIANVYKIGKLHTKRFDTDYDVILEQLKDILPLSIPTEVSSVKRRVGVLISGTGTNLEALLEFERTNIRCGYQIVVVISSKPNVGGLEIAKRYGVPTKVVNHRDFSTRVEFDSTVQSILTAKEFNCEFICLAGFMRIFGVEFVLNWRGKSINIHPSLLPSFKGGNAHRDVLESGVRISGATVHFVVEDIDAGGIISQGAVPVEWNDDIKSLSERVKSQVEYRILPQALDDLVKQRCWLTENNTVEWIK